MEPLDLRAWVEGIISNFWSAAPENSLRIQPTEKAFDAPVIGFSSGSDPLYQELKADIGSFYMTPLEVFTQAFPQTGIEPHELTVVSWILPHIEATKAENRREMSYPSERWARGKLYGEAFNSALRRHLVAALKNSGFAAVAPVISPSWSAALSPRYGMASNWSERHAAYISGLGTFGLCDGLITPRGKAMRCGSVVARIGISPTVRPYTDHHEYCLHFSHGACGQCIRRCPVGAISENGHDKVKCSAYLKQLATDYVKNRWGLETDVCGLCQTGVSCESRIPVRR